jgi:hypothetical protein
LLPVFFVFTLRHAMVAAPMRTRFDRFGKQMVRAALETRGPVETDAEVPADTRRIDLWFMPDPARGSVPDHLGVLGASRVARARSSSSTTRRAVRISPLPDQARRVPPLPFDTQDDAVGPDPVGDLVGPTLVAWLRLAGTRSADEIAAAIRSFRAS